MYQKCCRLENVYQPNESHSVEQQFFRCEIIYYCTHFIEEILWLSTSIECDVPNIKMTSIRTIVVSLVRQKTFCVDGIEGKTRTEARSNKQKIAKHNRNVGLENMSSKRTIPISTKQKLTINAKLLLYVKRCFLTRYLCRKKCVTV